MKEKQMYTAEEVAQMCVQYHEVKGGIDGPVSFTILKNYEESFPMEIQKIIGELEQLAHDEKRLNLKK